MSSSIGNSSVEVFAVGDQSARQGSAGDRRLSPGGLAPCASQANTGLFDVLGRRFTVGAKFKL